MELTEKFELESQVVRLFSSHEFVQEIKSKTINTTIEQIKNDFPTLNLTLIIIGLPSARSTSEAIERESTLAELQLVHECNIQKIPASADALIKILSRFTKAIAQIPFK